MSGQPRFGQTKAPQGLIPAPQHLRDNIASPQMGAMCSPSAEDHIWSPLCQVVQQQIIVAWANRVCCGLHHARVCCSECEKIGDPNGSKSKTAGPSFTALDRGIVLNLCRCRGVQHDKHHPRGRFVPASRQKIPVSLTVGIYGLGRCISFQMSSANHGLATYRFRTRLGFNSPP